MGVLVGVDVGTGEGVAVCVLMISGVSVALGTSVISGINVGSGVRVSGVLGVAPEHAARTANRILMMIKGSVLFIVPQDNNISPGV